MVVDNHTIDDSHGGAWVGCYQKGTKWARAQECTKVRKPYKRTASNQHAAPSNPRAAVPSSQETDMRIQHDPRPLLRVARVQAGVHWGGGRTPGVRTNERVHKGEIYMNSREFVRTSYEICANFLRIHVNSRL